MLEVGSTPVESTNNTGVSYCEMAKTSYTVVTIG